MLPEYSLESEKLNKYFKTLKLSLLLIFSFDKDLNFTGIPKLDDKTAKSL